MYYLAELGRTKRKPKKIRVVAREDTRTPGSAGNIDVFDDVPAPMPNHSEIIPLPIPPPIEDPKPTKTTKTTPPPKVISKVPGLSQAEVDKLDNTLANLITIVRENERGFSYDQFKEAQQFAKQIYLFTDIVGTVNKIKKIFGVTEKKSEDRSPEEEAITLGIKAMNLGSTITKNEHVDRINNMIIALHRSEKSLTDLAESLPGFFAGGMELVLPKAMPVLLAIKNWREEFQAQRNANDAKKKAAKPVQSKPLPGFKDGAPPAVILRYPWDVWKESNDAENKRLDDVENKINEENKRIEAQRTKDANTPFGPGDTSIMGPGVDFQKLGPSMPDTQQNTPPVNIPSSSQPYDPYKNTQPPLDWSSTASKPLTGLGAVNQQISVDPKSYAQKSIVPLIIGGLALLWLFKRK